MRNSYFKWIVLILAVIALIAGLIGCESQSVPAATSSASFANPAASTAAIQPTTSAKFPTTASAAPVDANHKIIVDMFGRKLTVAKPIKRVLTSGPVECNLVYLIAPDKLVGLVAGYYGDPPLVPDKYIDLPIVGGWYGAQVGNYEVMMTYNPDIILEGKLENLPERQQKFGTIPVVGDDTGSDLLLHFEKCITFIGDILDAQEQATTLNNYYLEAMRYVNSLTDKIPKEKRVRVYYAEGLDGLNTDPVGSFHNNLIEFCGGLNVAEKIPMVPGYGMSQVSLENVLAWDPDIIVLGRATPPDLKQTILNDPNWQQLRAVQNRQIFVRPDNPFSIFDGPPGPCQILGLYWMIHTLYPEQTKDLDLNAKFKEFYSKFFHYDLTDDEIIYLLSND